MKRQRGRGRKSNGGGHHHHHHQNRNFESNGPDVKIRGSASQVYEKYQQYARDAASAGDRVAAESFLQHAEHYYRLMRSQQQHQQQNQQNQQQQNPQQNNPQAQNRPDDFGNRDYNAGGYANGRDEFDEAPEPMHAAPQPAAAASPLDVVDPEAVEAASAGDREEHGGDEQRGRRRRRRRYEGGSPSGAGDLGAEAADAGQTATFDRASNS